MCQKCFQNNIEQFPAYWDFEKFDTDLSKKIFEKILVILQLEGHKNIYHLDSIYECVYCKEQWYLSIPENAWRGYFLNKNYYSQWEKHFFRIDKLRKIGCLFILLLIISTLLYLFFS